MWPVAVPPAAWLRSPVCSSPKWRAFSAWASRGRRQSSLENVLMINVSGPSDEDAAAGAYLNTAGRCVCGRVGWMGEWLALVIVSTPVRCVFAWVRLSDGGCALPHRGHYPLLVSAGLHLGGQRDSDMSTWWEAADGWTPTRLSRWVSVSLVYVVSLLCVFIMVCWSHCNVCILHIWFQFGLPQPIHPPSTLHSDHIEWFFLCPWSLQIWLLDW